MSAEDSAAPGPQLRFVDLQQLIREGMMDSLAISVAFVRVIQENADEHPKAVEGILLGAWTVVKEHLKGRQVDHHSVAFLNEYFSHAGDWGAMRECMIKRGEANQLTPGEFSALCDKKLEQCRKEFAQQIAAPARTAH